MHRIVCLNHDTPSVDNGENIMVLEYLVGDDVMMMISRANIASDDSL
jgi:hypothetical protein